MTGKSAADALELAGIPPDLVISHSLAAVENLEHTFPVALNGVGSVLP